MRQQRHAHAAMAAAIGIMVFVKLAGLAFVIFIPPLLSAEIGPQPTADPGSARAALEHRYAEMDADYNSGNLDRLSAMVLPDAIVGPMKVPFSKAIEEIKAELRKGSKLTVHSLIEDIALHGDSAVLSVRSDMTLTSTTGNRYRHVRATDTWLKTSDGWKLKESDLMSSRPVVPPTDNETAATVITDLKRYAVPLTTVSAEGRMSVNS